MGRLNQTGLLKVDGHAKRAAPTADQCDAGFPEKFFICSACRRVLEPRANGGFCAKCARPTPFAGSRLDWERQRIAWHAQQTASGKATAQ